RRSLCQRAVHYARFRQAASRGGARLRQGDDPVLAGRRGRARRRNRGAQARRTPLRSCRRDRTAQMGARIRGHATRAQDRHRRCRSGAAAQAHRHGHGRFRAAAQARARDGVRLALPASGRRAADRAVTVTRPHPEERAQHAPSPRINRERLIRRLATFNRIGALPGGGNCRLALSDEDRAGRGLLGRWMGDLGLAVSIHAIGNHTRGRRGGEDTAPVMFGSHVDTVGTGGRYDGLYGVLAGLEICETLGEAATTTRRPLALVAFTNEEGSRFAPYAMGSLVYVGGLSL